jgi:hypothetical protein
MSSVLKYCPMLSKDKLESEFSVVYRSDTFANVKSVFALWNLVKEKSLENTLSEVHRLVETEVTPPVSTAESERCFILKRVKTYLRNSMGQHHLNAGAVLSIHKNLIADIPRFNQKVVELFASQKNRRGQFLYK